MSPWALAVILFALPLALGSSPATASAVEAGSAQEASSWRAPPPPLAQMHQRGAVATPSVRAFGPAPSLPEMFQKARNPHGQEWVRPVDLVRGDAGEAAAAPLEVLRWLDTSFRPVLEQRGTESEEFRRWHYDAHGHVVLEEVWGAGDVHECVGYAYDAAERLVREDRGASSSGECYVPQASAITSWSAHSVVRVWDDRNRMERVETSAPGEEPRSMALHYDAWNRLRAVDPGKNSQWRTSWALDGAGRVVAEQNAEDAVFATERDALGRVVREWDSALRERAGPGAAWKREYDRNGRMIAEHDPLGGETAWTYVGGDRLVSVLESASDGIPGAEGNALDPRTTTFSEFDGRGLPRMRTEADGLEWSMSWSALGQLESECALAPGESPACRSRTYLQDGSLASVEDFAGERWRFAYDTRGLRTLEVDPLGNEVQRSLDAAGRVVREENARGGVTRWVYDALGRPASEWRSAPGYETAEGCEPTPPPAPEADLLRVAAWSYNASGDVVSAVDGRCNETRYSHDDRGLLEHTEWLDVDGEAEAVETRAYSDAGYLERIVDADGVIVTFEHDAVGRVIEEAVGDSVTRTEWDALGRVSRVVGPRHEGPSAPGRVFAYDGFGRLAEVTDEAGNQTRYWYDAADRLERTEEHAAMPSGEVPAAVGAPGAPLVTEREYTPLGYLRVHRQVGASGPVIATTYSEHTPTGLPERIEDARGQVQVLEYDALGRRTLLTLEGQAADLPWQLSSVTWDYHDTTGRLVVTEQKVGAAEGTFEDIRVVERDALDRVSRTTETRGADGGELVQEYGYDLDGRRTSLRTLLDNGPPEETRWSWDARGRLDTLEVISEGASPEVTQYTHSLAGRPLEVAYPNATRAVYAWDFDNGAPGARGLLTGITHSELVPEGSDIPLAAVTYAYDPAGNRERQTLTLDGASETTHYGYDVIDQLARVTVVPASGPLRNVSYTHVGHERVRELHRENCELDDDDPSICTNGVVSDRHFQWNDLRQLESVHEQYPGAAGLVQAWEYDAAGNLEARLRYELDEDDQPVLAERDEFRWDGLGRMVESARGPPGTPQILGQYDYDAQGLRIRVRGTTRNADAWYDGLNLLVERTPASASEDAAPLMRHHYDPMGLHAQRARHDGPTSLPTTHYAHRDALGTTLLMSRPAMSSDPIAASYRTDPWGRITHESGGAHLNPTVFTGHQHDTETGLIYMRARYYDPTIGRFLSQDPWLGDQNFPASLNRYLYAYGNPGAWWDPDGLCPLSIDSIGGLTRDLCGIERQREEQLAASRAADAQQAAAVAEARRLECVDELGHPHAVPIQIGNASRCTRQMSPQEREENLFLSDAERAGLAFTRNVAEGTAIGVGVLLSVANPATTAVAGLAYGGYRIGEAVHGQRVALNDGEFGVEQMSAGERGAAAAEGAASMLLSMAGYGNLSRVRQAPTSRQLSTERISDPQRMLPGGAAERVATEIANPVPSTVARVIPDNPITRASGTLGRPDASDVFVTAASDIRGLSASQIAERLSIPQSASGFRIVEFPTPPGIASPVNRSDPGFVGGGRTAGGAREFVVPNSSIPPDARIRVVR